MLATFLHSTLVMTTPLLLAALGGMVNRSAGLVNIGLESMMLLGAFVALVVSAQSGSWLLALIAAALAGGLAGWLMALVVTRLDANEIVVGLGLNVAVASLLRFVMKTHWGPPGNLVLPDVVMLPALQLPGLSAVPLLGTVLNGLNPLTWLAWLLVPLTAWALRETRLGLRLRAAGAAPETARALGLSPFRLREAATLFAGMLAGLGGAHLAIGVVGLFNEGIVAGRGFIALAAFYFGGSQAWLTAACATLFGLLDAAQIRLQGGGLPAELVQTLPYLSVIVALVTAAWLRKPAVRKLP